MGQLAGTDRLIARQASSFHGLVTRARLLTAGVTDKEIRVRLARGSLIQVHRGVYRVGHLAPSVEASYLAAVLGCGDGSFLGGRAAAHALELMRGRPPAPRVWSPVQRRLSGVVVRRYRAPLGPGETRIHRGIPMTSPARTLVDLAPSLPKEDLAAAFHEARVKFKTTEKQVLAVLDCHPTAPARAVLRAVLLGDTPVTLSELEREFCRVLTAACLPLPDEINRVASARRVDCRYVDPPLTIELDSYGYHGDRHAWEQDRRRDRETYARGDELRRYTYGDVFEDTSFMLAELAVLLGERPI